MSIDRRFYTFIIAGHANGRVRRISLPYPVLLVIGFFASVGVMSAGVASYHIFHMVVKVQQYDHLLAENDSFRVENLKFSIQTSILGEKIDFLETLAHKVAVLSGMNAEKSVGGVGGMSKDSLRAPLPITTASLSSFDRYSRSVKDLEGWYRGMGEFFSKKILVAASTPDRMPVRGYVSGGVGVREDPFKASAIERHAGLDICAPYGSSVRAPADGLVIFAGQRAGYGNLVIIDHRFGLVTRYGHLSKMNVKIGQKVNRSDVIGYVGTTGRTTGPHLHYEVWNHNSVRDPMRFLSRTSTG